MKKKQRSIWVVILAGGDGRRLGALTANADGISTPKQYCSLNGGPSLLQLSLQRALGITSRERIVTVVTETHRSWWERELFALHRCGVVVQPSNRGTGLGILLPLSVIAKSDPDAGVLCMPSDHYVEHESVLAEFLRQATAQEILDSDKLTLLGMSPHAPDSGFGYLCPAPDSGVGMRPVHRFIEKPDEPTAAALIRAGGVWSTGIFSGRIAEIARLYLPQSAGVLLDLNPIVRDWRDFRIPSAELASLYARYPALDFSRDVLQNHPDRLQYLTVPPCGWSDVGRPARLANTLWSLRSRNNRGTDSDSMRGAFNLATALDRAASAAGTGHARAACPDEN